MWNGPRTYRTDVSHPSLERPGVRLWHGPLVVAVVLLAINAGYLFHDSGRRWETFRRPLVGRIPRHEPGFDPAHRPKGELLPRPPDVTHFIRVVAVGQPLDPGVVEVDHPAALRGFPLVPHAEVGRSDHEAEVAA